MGQQHPCGAGHVPMLVLQGCGRARALGVPLPGAKPLEELVKEHGKEGVQGFRSGRDGM